MTKLKVTAAEMVAAARARIDEVETTDLIARVGDADTVIVDIRDIRERQRTGYIPGSVHAPRGMIEFWVDPDSPYHKEVFAQPGKRYVFHCASGWRSALTVATLQDMGFDAAHLREGFSAWAEQGGPVEKPEPDTHLCGIGAIMTDILLSDRTDGREAEIAALFRLSFTAAESADEGAAIAALVDRLYETTPPDDLRTFLALRAGALVGGILFSRMTFASDPRAVFLLSPVAVHPDHQRQGVGQTLLRHGLDTLRRAGVAAAVTYGDPVYYRQVGFCPATTQEVPAPQPLSQPHGWQICPLAAADLPPLPAPARTVPAFDDPALW